MKSWDRAMRNAYYVIKVTRRRAQVRGVWLASERRWFYYARSVDRTDP